MRHLNMTCQESRDFVQTKRPIVCPNPVFTEQLEAWEKCRFDLQNVSIVDQGPDPDLVSPSCTTEGKKGDTEGGEEAKQGAETTHEQLEKELQERKREMRKKMAETGQSKPGYFEGILMIPWGLDSPLGMIAKSQEPQNVDKHSTADDSSCDDASAKRSSAPVPALTSTNNDDHSAADYTGCKNTDASTTESPPPVPATAPVNADD